MIEDNRGLPPLDIEAALNPEQAAAATHGDGPQLILAGAGSGKTRVITYRIAWLIRERGVEPWRIAAVTFTNKAAREMQERVERLAGSSSGVFVGTFHRFSVRLLRRYGERIGLARDFSILDSADQRALVKEALQDEGLAESAFPPRAVLSRISAAKNKLLTPSQFEREAEGFFETRVATIYRRYQGLLRKVGGLDFDDLIFDAVRLLQEEPELGQRMRQRLRYLLVDEYQDTNHSQLQLIYEINGKEGNLTAVGDEDQSIYRWRGAELENILNFEKFFPGAVIHKLERNYRSTQTILDASGALVANNEKRRGKSLWTEGDEGAPVELYRGNDEGDEAQWIVSTLKQLNGSYRYRDMAILVRTNAQTRSIEDELLRRRIPYCLVAGTRFYDRAEVKDVIAYLRVLRNPNDSHSMRRILNRPPRGIGKATQEVVFHEADNHGGSIWDVLRHERFGSLSARAANALIRFREVILDLRKLATEQSLPDLLEQLLEKTGYIDVYQKDDPDSQAKLENLRELLSAAQEFVEDYGREHTPALEHLVTPEKVAEESSQNRDQLLLTVPSRGPLRPVEALPDDPFGSDDSDDVPQEDAMTMFLDYVSLVSDADSLDTELGVSVMTMHAAKGLEFPIVVIPGLEDGLLPHFNAQDTRDEIEEERRLLYVGMTRAERRLFMTTCRRRRIAGRYQDQLESAFLGEIPEQYLTVHASPTLFRSPRPTVSTRSSAKARWSRASVSQRSTIRCSEKSERAAGCVTRPWERAWCSTWTVWEKVRS